MADYLPSIKNFLENFQTDENLKQFRKFVNVYQPREEDIKAITAGNYEISELQCSPEVYGGKNIFTFKVGGTSFRIWGEAAEYIENRSKT